MAWTNLTFAFGSLLTSSKMTQLDDNFDALAAKDSGAPVLANGYIVEAMYGAGSVNRTALKTTTGEVSENSGGITNFTLPGGTYGFYPQIKMNATTSRAYGATINGDYSTSLAGFTSYATNISLDGVTGIIYAQQRYIQSSPPYKIGDVLWGHFIFLLRNISTSVVKAAYEAEDPPWAYNGFGVKDSKERIQRVPHPFIDYWSKDPAIDGLEIILVDLRNYDTEKWRSDNEKLGKGILEDLSGKVAPQGIIKPSDVGLTIIAGFTDKVKIMNRI